MQLSDRIRVLMALNNENQKTLSEKTGIAAATLMKIQRTNTTRIDVVNVIAQHYGVTVDWLCNGKVILEGFGIDKKY